MSEQILWHEPDTTKWLPEKSRHIVERFIVSGELKLVTPAHFGGGEGTGTDIVLLEDTVDHHPLLPGTSITGALRNYLLTREKGYFPKSDKETLAEKLFGVSHDETDGEQSRVIVDDAHSIGKSWSTEYRDGVKLDPTSRTAEDKKLFNMQLWPTGTAFNLCFELLIYQDDHHPQQIKQAFAAALSGLADGSITLGMRKNRGFGQVTVASWSVTGYDLQSLDGLADWLWQDGVTETTTNLFDYFGVDDTFVDMRTYARIKATYAIDGSLLIRAGSDVAEMAHLTSNGRPILSGTAVAGALRARAQRITWLRKPHNAQQIMDRVFGPIGEDGDEEQNLTASRLVVSEQIIQIPENQTPLVQSRVKIDRFTGGAYETALFDQQPVFGNDETLVDITLDIHKPQNEDVGLMLLLLKDLWTGDLPLGGESSVGRGRLRGISADIAVKMSDTESEETWTIFDDKGALRIDGDREKLEAIVSSEWEY